MSTSTSTTIENGERVTRKTTTQTDRDGRTTTNVEARRTTDPSPKPKPRRTTDLLLALALAPAPTLALALTLPLSRRAARGEMGKRSLGGSNRPAEGQPRLRRACHARWHPSGRPSGAFLHIMLGRRYPGSGAQVEHTEARGVPPAMN